MIADQSIKVTKKTKERLDFAKIHPRETYDDLICRLLDKQEGK